MCDYKDDVVRTNLMLVTFGGNQVLIIANPYKSNILKPKKLNMSIQSTLDEPPDSEPSFYEFVSEMFFTYSFHSTILCC